MEGIICIIGFSLGMLLGWFFGYLHGTHTILEAFYEDLKNGVYIEAKKK